MFHKNEDVNKKITYLTHLFKHSFMFISVAKVT